MHGENLSVSVTAVTFVSRVRNPNLQVGNQRYFALQPPWEGDNTQFSLHPRLEELFSCFFRQVCVRSACEEFHVKQDPFHWIHSPSLLFFTSTKSRPLASSHYCTQCTRHGLVSAGVDVGTTEPYRSTSAVIPKSPSNACEAHCTGLQRPLQRQRRTNRNRTRNKSIR